MWFDCRFAPIHCHNSLKGTFNSTRYLVGNPSWEHFSFSCNVSVVVLPPGFEPEYSAREAEMIGRTTLREHLASGHTSVLSFINYVFAGSHAGVCRAYVMWKALHPHEQPPSIRGSGDNAKWIYVMNGMWFPQRFPGIEDDR